MKKSFLFLVLCLVLLLVFLFFLKTSLAYEFDDWSDEDSLTEVLDEEVNDMVMGTVYMQGKFLDGDILKISVEVSEMIQPILGIAFHLTYDSEALAFLKYEPGEFLERGGDPFYLVQNDSTKEKIIYGQTLRRDDSFPLGDGQITDLYFQILDGEQFELGFENGVISTLDTVRQDIDQIDWVDLFLDKNNPGKTVSAISNNSVFDGINPDSSVSYFGGTLYMLFIFAAAAISAFLIIRILKKKHEKELGFPLDR